MKNIIKLFGAMRSIAIIALLAIIVFSMAGCATTTIAGAHTDHGLFSGSAVESIITATGAKKVESYTNILGFIDKGFDKYAEEVIKLDRAGKKIVTVTTNYFYFVSVHTAYVEEAPEVKK